MGSYWITKEEEEDVQAPVLQAIELMAKYTSGPHLRNLCHLNLYLPQRMAKTMRFMSDLMAKRLGGSEEGMTGIIATILRMRMLVPWTITMTKCIAMLLLLMTNNKADNDGMIL